MFEKALNALDPTVAKAVKLIKTIGQAEEAYNQTGDSGYSNVASATTLPPPPPAAPSNLTADAVTKDRIDLTWQDNSDNEDGFKIERIQDRGNNGEFIQINGLIKDLNKCLKNNEIENAFVVYEDIMKEYKKLDDKGKSKILKETIEHQRR